MRLHSSNDDFRYQLLPSGYLCFIYPFNNPLLLCLLCAKHHETYQRYNRLPGGVHHETERHTDKHPVLIQQAWDGTPELELRESGKGVLEWSLKNISWIFIGTDKLCDYLYLWAVGVKEAGIHLTLAKQGSDSQEFGGCHHNGKSV